MTDRLVLRSSRVLQSDGTFRRAAIRMQGAFIEDVVQEGLDSMATASDETVVDVGSMPVTPAFVNAHTHVSLGFLRGLNLSQASAGNLVEDFFFRIERDLTAPDVRAFARMGAYECLLNGVGLVWDHYYYADAIVEALIDVGLTGVVAPTLQDSSGPGVDQLEAQLDATERIARSGRLETRGIFAALGPHATDTVSADLWRCIGDTAARLQLPVHSHAAQSGEESLRALERHGMSPLAWLKSLEVFDQSPMTLLVHCLYASELDLRDLNAATTTLGFCPYAQRVFGFPADPRRWSEAGLDWFVATDTSAGNDSMNLQKELRAVAELRTTPTTYSPEIGAMLEGTSSVELQSARINAAQTARDESFRRSALLAEPQDLLSRVWGVPGSLHPAFKAGVIEQGALANLLVWNVDQPSFWPAQSDRAVLQALAMGDTVQAIDTAIIAGRIVGEVGDFARSVVRSDEYQAARVEAEERLAGLNVGG